MSWFTETIRRENSTVPSTIVETGTFHGDGVMDYLNFFQKIYSIELNEDYYKEAVQKFRMCPHVKLIHGDSATELAKMDFGPDPVLFYLDAHFCGGTSAGGCGTDSPLLKELDAIMARQVKGDIIIIDDMRLMGKSQWEGTEGHHLWPRTWLDWSSVTENDIINHLKDAQLIKMCQDKDRLFVLL